MSSIDLFSESSPEADLVLVPGPHRVIILDQRAPLLLNCSVNITGSNQLHNYIWIKDGKLIEVNRNRRKPRVRETNRNKFKDLNRPLVSIFPNGSLYLPNGASSLHGIRNATKNRKLDGIYECIVNTTKGVALARRVRVFSAMTSFRQDILTEF
ncbi:hypothetical protein Btru_065872 [Bulinus truncatus]|nr:hypothetical protein Btru_065872 [Bulinus truncatus]